MPYPMILYVEDDEITRDSIQGLLSLVLGYSAPGQVVTFEDSTDIITRVRLLPYKPDLILLDIQMMPFNGIQVLKMLRMLPEYDTTPIAAFTASVMSDEMYLLRVAGFNGCIGKPFDLQELATAIEHLLQGKAVWPVY